MTNKELKALLKICQDQGVRSLDLNGIKIEFKEHWITPTKSNKSKDLSIFSAPSIDEQVDIPTPQIKEDTVESDELTQEELLFYSSNTEQ